MGSMGNKKTKVCILIPAFNEAKMIGKVVGDAVKTFKKEPYKVSIVVIDDGSHDKTASLAKKAGAIVIDHILNTGAGGATATGLAFAKKMGFDIAVTMDADGQHHIGDVVAGIKLILKRDSADLIIGSRLINTEGMSFVKIVGNKGLGMITRVLFGVNVSDSQSGLRLFSRHAIENLRWESSGYEFCSEMLWRAKQQKMKVGEYPIRAIYTDYSKAKGQNNWNAVYIIRSLVRKRVLEFLV